jgi:hypothetical protein
MAIQFAAEVVLGSNECVVADYLPIFLHNRDRDMLTKVSKYKSSIAIVLVLFLLVPIEVQSNNDPWVGTFIAKETSNYFSIVRKLTFSKARDHDYSVEMEISRFLSGDDKRGAKIKGYAEIYQPTDDKTASARMFVHFPGTKFRPFLEIYPGQKSSPVRNAKGYFSLHYAYFENSEWRSYVADELIRATKTVQKVHP